MTNKASSFCRGLRHNVSLSDPSNRSLWKKDIRMEVFHNKNNVTGAANTATNDELKSFITKAKTRLFCARQTQHLLAAEIGKKVFSFLLKPVEDLETSYSLSDLGIDSLVAIKVRQWWKTVFQFDISVLEMMGMGTLDVLGEHAVKGMLRIFHSDIQSS
ncbi:uncharacterized protein FFB14_13560 [Fusarium fujikuroi]|nr:uncharacterized protein FFB14_13560 [Fusarium fujikuroi]